MYFPYCAFYIAANPKNEAELTLLDGTELFLEVYIQRGSSHFFLRDELVGMILKID